MKFQTVNTEYQYECLQRTLSSCMHQLGIPCCITCLFLIANYTKQIATEYKYTRKKL